MYLRQGARFPVKAHLCICIFLHRGGISSSNSFLQGQCLVYCSHSCTVASWGSGVLPQKDVLEPNCLQRRKMPLRKMGGMEKVPYEW